MKRICLFVRVSTDKQDYDRQIHELTEYCKSRDFEITKTIATQISGADKTRPDIEALIQSAKDNEFDKVLVTELSRLGRDPQTIRRLIYSLHDLHKSIIFKDLMGGMESMDDLGNESLISQLIIAVYTAMAKEERERISMRIKSKLKQLKDNGKVLGRKLYEEESPEKFLSKYPEVLPEVFSLSISSLMTKYDLSKGTVVKIRKIYRKQLNKNEIQIQNR